MNNHARSFSFFPYPVDFASCTVTLGNFDGCHRGHQALVHQNQALAKKLHCPDLVFSFFPKPQEFLQPTNKTMTLLNPERKARAFKELGASHHFILKVNEELLRCDHETFYKSFLRDTLHVKALTVGENFRFGHLRKGDAEWLRTHAKRDGIEVNILPSLHCDGELISSTRIRKALSSNGNVELAQKLLGHPYSLEGKIVKGQQLGRKLGFPTINLSSTSEAIIPSDGVYCGFVWLEGQSSGQNPPIVTVNTQNLLAAVFSIGSKPTLQDSEETITIEAHVLSKLPLSGESYGRRSSFYFTNKLRDIITFKDLDGLKLQIAQDISSAKGLI